MTARLPTELFRVQPLEAARARLEALLPARRPPERRATAGALGRVLAAPVHAPHDLPAFARSAMDGYAVRALDTHGASAGLPADLTLVGEVEMGRAPTIEVGPGEAAAIPTGGMLPAGADAVVMVEHTGAVDARTIEVFRPAAAGEHVIQVGEDVRRGEPVLPAGRILGPRDLGALLALGVTEVEVARAPRVAILTQGDEVVPPEAEPGPAQVRDVNGATLAALVRQAGGEPVRDWPILPDRPEPLLEAAREALARCDVVVIAAGSSVGARDLTADAIAALGEPGILAHGLSIKPGKPTLVAACQGKPVFGLPGNPVSALIVFELLVAPTLATLLGCRPPAPTTIAARLARNVPSQSGREDHVPVRLEDRDGTPWAVPVFGRSNLIFTLVRADGLIVVPLDRTGLSEGDEVTVVRFPSSLG